MSNEFDINRAAHGSNNNIKFINSREGFIIGSIQEKMYLLKTDDAGDSWHKQEVNKPQEYSIGYNVNPYQITFSGANKEYGVFPVEMQYGDNVKAPFVITYHTIDGGN